MCRHTNRAESPVVYFTTSVSAYCNVCVRILLHLCLHTSICVVILTELSPPWYTLPHMCPHTTTYVSAYYYRCVVILLQMCRHTKRAESPQRPSKTKTTDLRVKSPDLRAHSPPKTPQRTPAMRRPEAGANSLPAGGVGASAAGICYTYMYTYMYIYIYIVASLMRARTRCRREE
jgi:hypothetical protein